MADRASGVSGSLLVVGNACLDVAYRLSTLPRPGETINAVDVRRDLGGKGLNQAVAAARAGASVRFVAAVGDDAAGASIRRLLDEEGISPADLVARSGACDGSVVLLDVAGETIVVTDATLAGALQPVDLAAIGELSHGDALLLQGNLSERATRWAHAKATASGARVIVNPAPFSAWWPTTSRPDVAVLNAVEAAQWTGGADAAACVAAIDADVVVVTLGPAGCLLSVGDQVTSIGAPTVEAIDTTGAGDVFVGAFAARWLESGDAHLSARFAVLAATDATTREGAASAIPSRAWFDRLRAGSGAST